MVLSGNESEDPETTRSSTDIQKGLVQAQLDRLQRICIGQQALKDSKGQEHISRLSPAQTVTDLVAGCDALANLLIADQDAEFVRDVNVIMSNMNKVETKRERGGPFDVMQNIRKSLIEYNPDEAMRLAMCYHRLCIGLCQKSGFLDAKRKKYGYDSTDGPDSSGDRVPVSKLFRVGLITQGKISQSDSQDSDAFNSVEYIASVRGQTVEQLKSGFPKADKGYNPNSVVVVCQKCGSRWKSVRYEDHGSMYFDDNVCGKCGSHDVIGHA